MMKDEMPNIRTDGYKAFLKWYLKSRAPLFLFVFTGVLIYKLVLYLQ